MEAALAAGYICEHPQGINKIDQIVSKIVSMVAPPSIQVIIDLPPTPGDHSANKSSHTTDEVGRWD